MTTNTTPDASVSREAFYVERCIRTGYRGGKRNDGWNIKREGRLIDWYQWKSMAQEKAAEMNASEPKHAA